MEKTKKSAFQAAADELIQAQKDYDKNKTQKNLDAKTTAAAKVNDLACGRPVKDNK